jgi:alpha-L-rhamnosidase
VPSGVEAETSGPGGTRILSAGVHAWTIPSPIAEPLGAVSLDTSLAQVIDDAEALAVVEETLAEHRPAAVEAMRTATRWTRGQTLAEVVFQYASPAVQREIGDRLAALSAGRASASARATG